MKAIIAINVSNARMSVPRKRPRNRHPRGACRPKGKKPKKEKPEKAEKDAPGKAGD